ASRSELRDTPNAADSSRSVGSRSPGRSSPSAIISLIRSTGRRVTGIRASAPRRPSGVLTQGPSAPAGRVRGAAGDLVRFSSAHHLDTTLALHVEEIRPLTRPLSGETQANRLFNVDRPTATNDSSDQSTRSRCGPPPESRRWTG